MPHSLSQIQFKVSKQGELTLQIVKKRDFPLDFFDISGGLPEWLSLFSSINDRVISANNVSLEGVDYATAVQVLRDSGQTVNLVVKRRVILPPTIPAAALTGDNAAKYLNVNR